MSILKLTYNRVETCPLCGGEAVDRAELARSSYSFGPFRIPLPSCGVQLRECLVCSLLFKNAVPESEGLAKVLSSAARNVWRPKQGVHPAVAWLEPHIRKKPVDILDIGASNGDLLRQLKPYAARLSALDVAIYPRCQEVVTGEYIVGEIEGDIRSSGCTYDIVTAFDIFEHFIEPRRALENIARLVKTGGRLFVETGDWTYSSGDLGRWYYSNLFEHQIFWSKRALTHACEKFGFGLAEYNRVNHKSRRALKYPQRIALSTVVALASLPGFCAATLAVTGRDPSLFGSPSLQDHAFSVLVKTCAK